MEREGVPGAQPHAGTVRGSLLLVVPGVLLGCSWIPAWAQGPAWLGANPWTGTSYDPDYIYLLNGLAVAEGSAPAYTLHPGTPVHLLVGAILRLVHAIAGEGEIVSDVLERPETYLHATVPVLLGLYALGLTLLGFATLRATGSVLAGIVAELTPLLSPTITARVGRVTPDPVVLALTALAVTLVLRTIARPERARSVAEGGMLGVLCGLAAAAKLFALPLVLLGIAFRGVRARAAIAVGSAASFALVTLPSWGLFDLEGFLLNVRNHDTLTGLRYARAVLDVASTQPALLLGLAAASAAAALDRDSNRRRVLVAIGATQLGALLLTARHGGAGYMMAGLGLTGAAIALSLGAWWKRLSTAPRVWAVVVILGATAGVAYAQYSAVRRIARTRDLNLATARALADVSADANVLLGYGASSPAAALLFGDAHTRSRYESWITRQYPGALLYDQFTGSVVSYADTVLRVSRDRRTRVLIWTAPLNDAQAATLASKCGNVSSVLVNDVAELNLVPTGCVTHFGAR